MFSTMIAAQGPQATRLMPSRAVRAIGRLLAWICSESRIRRGIEELSALDDRLLADIGLTRGHIAYTARHGTPPRQVSSSRTEARRSPKSRNQVPAIALPFNGRSTTEHDLHG